MLRHSLHTKQLTTELNIAVSGKDGPRCNHEITVTEVRLIDDLGEMMGVVSTSHAIKLAKEKNMDLVEISPGASPPVCKILSFGKYKYELQKKAQFAKKNQKIVETKEVKVRPTIADGDYQVKLKNAIKFIKQGDKVRFSLMFKGREITHVEVGFAVINKFKSDLEGLCKIEVEPKMEGKQIFMIAAPIPK